MNLHESRDRREVRAADRRRARRRGFVALGALVVVLVAVVVVIAGSSGSSPRRALARSAAPGGGAGTPRAGYAARSRRGSTVGGRGTGVPGGAPVPVLMYHVIAPPPGGALYPGLYVPATEFAAQMQALKDAGWHAVTLDQVRAYWTRGVPLGPGKPIVLTFDNGYRSQYTGALPVLQRLRWAADENIQLTGLPPSQGGITTAQVRRMIDAGWELDTQGISHANLATASAAELQHEIVDARRILRRRFGVPVNWFCYPSGQYNATAIAAVRSAGYVGSTTVVPGWANPGQDAFRLPRLRVLGGTSPGALLAQIASARSNPAPPAAYVTN